MDPDANLAEQAQIKKLANPTRADRARLRELQVALTDWIRGGGFLPKKEIT